MRRVLIDKCLPVQLYRWLEGIEAQSVTFMGWKGKRDRELLAAAKERFDVLVTGDGFIHKEQELASYGLGLVVVRPTQVQAVERLVPRIASAIRRVGVGRRIVVSVGRQRRG
jgi:predicted nuclease of predicted toxin-antitoxin system